jgi:porphobilinogen synthase
VRRVKGPFGMPTFTYEYAMLKAATERGWVDGKRVTDEALLPFMRARADAIPTYAALDPARKLARR